MGDPTDKVTDANSDKGDATSEKDPYTSGRNGTSIFAHVAPLVYGGPIPSTHLNHAVPPPKIVKNEDFDSWVYRFKRHLNHVNTNLWRIIEEGFHPHDRSNFTLEKPWTINSMRMLSSSFKMLFYPKISLVFDPSSWPKTHGIVLFPSIREVQAFNAPTMKWCKMKLMSL